MGASCAEQGSWRASRRDSENLYLIEETEAQRVTLQDPYVVGGS